MQPLSMAVLAGLTPSDVEVRFYDDRMEDIPFNESTDLAVLSVETFTALAHKDRPAVPFAVCRWSWAVITLPSYRRNRRKKPTPSS